MLTNHFDLRRTWEIPRGEAKPLLCEQHISSQQQHALKMDPDTCRPQLKIINVT